MLAAQPYRALQHCDTDSPEGRWLRRQRFFETNGYSLELTSDGSRPCSNLEVKLDYYVLCFISDGRIVLAWG